MDKKRVGIGFILGFGLIAVGSSYIFAQYGKSKRESSSEHYLKLLDTNVKEQEFDEWQEYLDNRDVRLEEYIAELTSMYNDAVKNGDSEQTKDNILRMLSRQQKILMNRREEQEAARLEEQITEEVP